MDTHGRESAIGTEIGEDAVLRNYTETAPARRELHDGGVCIALDNFCGQLNVAQPQALRPEAVKLDRGFPQQLGLDVESARAIRSLTGMIRPLGISVVAKGVNTEERLAAVLALNVDQAQGSLIGPPTAAADLTVRRRTFDPMELSSAR